MDRRAFLRRSGLGVGVGLAASQLTLVKQGRGRRWRRPPARRRQDRGQAHRVHALLGRLRGRRGRRERRLGAPGAGVRFADQPRRALRQGRVRCASTATASTGCKYPMKLVNGKYQRISWDQALNEIGAKMLELAQGKRARFGLLVGSLQAQQRAVVPAAQVRVASGAATTATTRRASATRTTVAGVANTWGYGAMTNSYNDMQNTQVRAVHRLATRPRRTRCRCCTCCTPRKPARR